MHRFDLSSFSRHSRVRLIALITALGLLLFSAVAAAADEFGYQAPAPDADTVQSVQSDTGGEREYSGWIEPGIGYVDGSNEGFGQYNALHSDGAYGVLNFDFRSLGKAGDTRYWRASGRDIGTGSGDLGAEFGDQGDYRIRLGFRQIERLDRQDSISVFVRGNNRLNLPSGYSLPADASDRSFYRDADLGVKREELTLGFEKVLSADWAIISDVRFEDKSGDKLTAVGQGFRGTALGVQQIDYRHTQVDLLLRHLDPRYHLEFGYYLSHFDNADRALDFENPLYSPRAGEPASAGTQQLALPPDSFFHQLRASGSLVLSDTARATGHVAFGRATQDETFLPYSTALFYDYDGDGSADAVPPPYPRNSLEGKVDHTNLQVALFNRLTSKLNSEISYRYENRDNRTPAGLYRHLHYDGEADEEWGNRVNSRERHTIAVEGKLRLPKRMRLKTGFEHQRTFRETELLEAHHHHSAEDTVVTTDTFSTLTSRDHVTREEKLWAQLRVPVSAMLSGKLKVFGSKRNTSSSLEFDEHINEHDAVAPSYLLDRDRIGIDTSANWQARPDLLVSANWQLARDDFKNSAFGPDSVIRRSGNLNLSFSPAPELSTNLFLGMESHLASQNSRGTGGDRGGAAVSDRWTLDVEDLAYHAGLGVDWEPTHDRYDIAFDYSFVDAENAISSAHEDDGKAHLPDTDVRIHRVSLESNIPLRKQLTFTTGYQYQRYERVDWAWNPENYAELGFGWGNPNGSAHALVFGMRFDF